MLVDAVVEHPSTKELLSAIESKGFRLTLELRGTAQKWVTGKNYFMGLTGPNGLAVSNAYGPIEFECPRAIDKQLVWVTEGNGNVASASEALVLAIRGGRIRRYSIVYNAVAVLVGFAR